MNSKRGEKHVVSTNFLLLLLLSNGLSVYSEENSSYPEVRWAKGRLAEEVRGKQLEGRHERAEVAPKSWL